MGNTGGGVWWSVFVGFKFLCWVLCSLLGIEESKDLLIRFVRMSDKNSQQKVIDEIMEFLRRGD